MSYLNELTGAIVGQVNVDDDVLSLARSRRNTVTDAAASFPGAAATYVSGSLAYGNAVRRCDDRSKGVDGDAGVILDRRTWNTLGPDSDAGDGPRDVVDEVREHLRGQLGGDHPGLRVATTEKRALRLTFNEPMPEGDPPVELVVALPRKGAPGLWIPNLKTNGWDPAHPQEHRRLVNTEPSKPLRVRRAQVVRSAKWWNNKRSTSAFSSFHLLALALETLTEAEKGRLLSSSVETFFHAAADSLEAGMTQDPAGVSGTLKLQNGITKDTAAKRLRKARDAFSDARAAGDDKQAVRDLLAPLFGQDIIDAAHDDVQAAALRGGNSRVVAAAAGIGVAAGVAAAASRISRVNPGAWRTN